MKFTVSSTELLSHLQAIGRVISNKNSMQILDYFLFEIKEDVLTMTASDIETTMITSMKVQDVTGDGKVAISSKLLLETLRGFSDQPLTFDIDNSTLGMVILSENGKFNFIGMNGDLYPDLPQLEEDTNQISVDTEEVEMGINKTFFCTADDELRPVMNGVYFDVSYDNIIFVATDAHKLTQYQTTEFESSATEEKKINFILPKKPATMLKSILPKESGKVNIKFDSKNIHFELENYVMICRQVEGKYPNYSAVIPKDNPYKLTVDRQSFLNTLRRVSIFSNQASNLIRLDIDSGKVNVSAQDIDFSISAEESLSCLYQGEPISIGFKSTFLIEMLSNLDTEEIIMELADPSRAGVVKPFNPDSDNTLMLLMPMKLND